MLHVSHICKTYPAPANRSMLHDVSLKLAPGDFVAILGASVDEKSTLLNLIAGLELPDSGTVTLNGTTLNELDVDARTRWRRRHMGFVFQSYLLMPHLTALDNAALSLKLNGVSHREAQQRAYAALTAMKLSNGIHRFPSALSGEESQRVAVARAMAHQPQLVLADEPTGNLGDTESKTVLGLLREQIKLQRSIGILVTQCDIAAAAADRVYRLYHSKLLPA